MDVFFGGLSLVTAAAAELDSEVAVQPGDKGGSLKIAGRKAGASAVDPTVTADSATRARGAAKATREHSDSGSDWQLALCACADAQLAQAREFLPLSGSFSVVWDSGSGEIAPQASESGAESVSVPASVDLAFSDGASNLRAAGLLAAIRAEAGSGVIPYLPAAMPGAYNETQLIEPSAGFDASALKNALLQSNRFLSLSDSGAADAAEAPLLAAEGGNEMGALQSHGFQGLRGTITPDIITADTANNGAGEQGAANLDPAKAAASTQLQTQQGEDRADNKAQSLAAMIEAESGTPASGERSVLHEKPAGLPEKLAAPYEKPAGEISSVASRPNSAEGVANPYASAAEAANTVMREASVPVASAETAQTRSTASHEGARNPNAAPWTPQQSGSAEVTTAATGERLPSELAFQAELKVRNSTTDSAQASEQASGHRQVTQQQQGEFARAATSAIREAGKASARDVARQGHEPKATNDSLESSANEMFRHNAGLSGGGDSSLSQNNAGGSPDRGSQQAAPFAAAAGSSQSASSVTPAPKAAAVPVAAQIDGMTDPPAVVTSQRVSSLAFQVKTEDRGAARVILSERAGQVHVTVRSSDPALTQSLRGDLGSLAGGLQQHGFDVKLWNPSSGSSTSDDARANAFEAGQDDALNQSRQRHTPDDPRQQGRRKGEWHEEID